MQFDELLSEISARLTASDFEETDGQIAPALRLVCEVLGLDRCSLFLRCAEPPHHLVLAHLFPGAGAGPAQHFVAFELKRLLPWIYGQLRQDQQTVIIPDVEGLPPGAATDQQRLREFRTKSELVVSLRLADKLGGCMEFATTTEPRVWTDTTVKHLQVLGNIFLNSLALNRAERALQESRARLLLAGESAGIGFWTIDARSGQLSLTSRTSELLRLGTGGEVDREALWALLHPEDRERVALATERALTIGENLQEECRLAFADQDASWISLRGSPLFGPTGKVRGLTGTMTCTPESKLSEHLKSETAYLRTEMRSHPSHGKIIGHSASIQRVLYQVEQVASADCAVLISGETGTGKELIAQEIHRLSKRKERAMVLVNCAALPSALVESELFGRERGAYTGALTTQMGHFELADGSSIFLDEVGELSMEVQAKLLRVLQHGEVQRLGNPKMHKVDVRVIAATNRDLMEELRKGRFREDLLYRLKVFPIEIPPLRERLEDIAQMVCVFLEEFSTRMGKKITKVPRQVIERLENHSWPGNIRELRNVIEHSVILTSGDTLKLSKLGDAPTRETRALTLAEAEREHILKALENTCWRIKGPHGAARRLDLEPSTLYSRMQKLGIPTRRQKDELSSERSLGKPVMVKNSASEMASSAMGKSGSFEHDACG